MDTETTFSIDQLVNGLGPILFESIRIPFGIFSRDHRVLWANEAMAALHRMSRDALVGSICYRACHGAEAPCADCHMKTVFENGKTRIVEQWFRFPGRERVWGEVHYYPIRGNDGTVAGSIVFGFDVTDRKNRIEVLRNYSNYLSEKVNGPKNRSQRIRVDNGGIAFTVKLSAREREILRLLTEGFTNMQIGALLSISHNTVKTHVNSIFNKLGVNDRTQAAVVATRQNIV